jgi:hypothetical protein
MAVPISNWGSGEWLTFAVIVATLLFTGGLLLFEVDRRYWGPARAARKRAAELYDPVETHFLVPQRSQGKISYVQQDDQEHWLQEIVCAAI